MTKQFSELTTQIESLHFRLIANQAGGLSLFKNIVSNQTSFHALTQLVASRENIAVQLLARIHALSTLETDNRYEHPYDTAMATYLLALQSAGSPIATIAARLLSNIPRLWWSEKIATQLISETKRKSPSANSFVPISTDANFLYPVAYTEAARDTVSWRVLHQTHTYNYAMVFGHRRQPTKIPNMPDNSKLILISMDRSQMELLDPLRFLASSSADPTGDILPHQYPIVEMERQP